MRLDLTNIHNTDKKPTIEFDLETNVVFISRRYSHSCDQFVISTQYGGEHDAQGGQEGTSQTLLNFNAKDGKVFSSLE